MLCNLFILIYSFKYQLTDNSQKLIGFVKPKSCYPTEKGNFSRKNSKMVFD
jgi:hypothetical protein